MTITEINSLILINEMGLRSLKDTLNPGRSIPYVKVGLLNTARRKQAKYMKNLSILHALRIAAMENRDDEQINTLIASLR